MAKGSGSSRVVAGGARTEDTAGAESSGGARGDRETVEQAIRDFRAGIDVEASFDLLFRRFSPSLTRQFVRWGADPDKARDLNQETFQRIFQDMESFRGGDELFEVWVGWIWRIARTNWLKSQRFAHAAKRPQNPEPLEVLDRGHERNDAGPALPLGQVLDQELEKRVRSAIDELPEQERKCVILFYYQEMKIREISVVLKIAQGTVKAHLNHARAKLKAGLEDWFEPDDEDRQNGRAV